MLFDAAVMSEQASMLWESSLLDRTGHFHSLDGLTIMQPLTLPDSLSTSSTFAELCQSRASQMISTGKKINLLWSGGADSSLVLLLLRQQGIDPDQLRILASVDSYRINPALGELINNTYELDSPWLHSEGLQYFMADNQALVSGIGLDMLTGCGFDVTENDCETLDELSAWLRQITGSTASDAEYQAIYDGLAEASGYPCTTIPEYSRLKNLLLCWQPELLHIGRLAGYGQYNEHYINFYTSETFQGWSLAQSIDSLSSRDDWGNKQLAVNLITELDPAMIPRPHCRQTLSMVHYQSGAQPVQTITDDWQYQT